MPRGIFSNVVYVHQVAKPAKLLWLGISFLTSALLLDAETRRWFLKKDIFVLIIVGQVHLLACPAYLRRTKGNCFSRTSTSALVLYYGCKQQFLFMNCSFQLIHGSSCYYNYCNWLVLSSGYTICSACQILAGPVFICSHYNTSEYTCNARSTAWYILEYVSSIVPSSPFIIIVIPNRRNATWVRGFSCYPMPGPHSIND